MRLRHNTGDSDSSDTFLTTTLASFPNLQAQHGRRTLQRYNSGDAEAVALLEFVDSDSADENDGDDHQRHLCINNNAINADGSDASETENVSVIKFDHDEDEPSWSIGLQVFIPYIIAGFGMVSAGLLLDYVQHWRVFKQVSEVFILVPSLLGLKGNLEMTLASRLSTQANLGNLRTRKDRFQIVIGNLALIQVQAIVIGVLAACAAMIFGWIPEGKFNMHHGLLLCTSSVFTASIASLLLGSLMSIIVILSHSCYINPDNVATPIAASLGDLITLALLSFITSLLFNALEGHLWLAPTVLVAFVLIACACFHVAHHNSYSNDVLYTGWSPVIGAMVISSIGGLILDYTVAKYSGIAVFQPVINGVGGNLVAVQASRLSTGLHKKSSPGILPAGSTTGCPNIFSVFFAKGLNARTNRVLLLLVIPGHLIFVYLITYLKAGHTSTTPIFICFYLVAAVIQVLILLYVGMYLVHWFWAKGLDPDNHTIPYLTALGDLLGTFLLAITFTLLYVVGDHDQDLGD